METWATVTLVLGSSAISALLTFFITKMQVSHSDKRQEAQLKASSSIDYKERRREVRSEPLLKLRNELAYVATWGERLVITLAMMIESFNKSSEFEGAQNLYKESHDHLNNYIQSGVLDIALHCIDDKEILERAKLVTNAHVQVWSLVKDRFVKNNPPDFPAVQESAAIISSNIRELQALINDRLEKL